MDVPIARVEIHRKLLDGGEVVTPAIFIPVDMLIRIGRHGANNTQRQSLWRLENRQRSNEYHRQWAKKKRKEERDAASH
jgi:hypothetical protein